MDAANQFAQEIASLVAAKLSGSTGVNKRVFTLADASEYTGLSEDAIRHKVAAGKMPTVNIDRKLRFDRRDLDRWIDEHRKMEE